ncbi:hypothetical protein SNEBB_009291 [Seison nebaliae]|nr:hypothetical protein SNEBB_009291 [Seison nebaliae]
MLKRNRYRIKRKISRIMIAKSTFTIILLISLIVLYYAYPFLWGFSTVKRYLEPLNDKHFRCSTFINRTYDQLNTDELYKQFKKEVLQTHGNLPQLSKIEELKTTKDLLDFCGNYFSKRHFYGFDPYLQSNSFELKYPLAFTMLLSSQDFKWSPFTGFQLLLAMIYRPQNYYVFHIDTKVENDPSMEIRKNLKLFQKLVDNCLPNALFTTTSINITYASYGRLEADLVSFKRLFQQFAFQLKILEISYTFGYWSKASIFKTSPWIYAMNLAASELPIMSNTEMVLYAIQLWKRGELSDIESYSTGWRFSDRYSNIWVIQDGLMKKMKTRKKAISSILEKPVNMMKGIAYNFLSRKYLRHVLFNSEECAKFQQWSHDTNSPDEFFWATLQNNQETFKFPPPILKPVNNTVTMTREIQWNNLHAKNICHGKYRHNICQFSIGDYGRLISSYRMVANKFSYEVDPVIYDCLNEHSLVTHSYHRTINNNRMIQHILSNSD